MLIKLIKYDLKSILKTLVPLWLTALILSGIFGIQIAFSFLPEKQLALDGIVLIFSILLFALFIAIFVITLLFVVQRFWNGLLKDEGYLMFTLPLQPRMLIFSKAISSLIVTILSGIAAVLSVAFLFVGVVMANQMNPLGPDFAYDIDAIFSQISFAHSNIPDLALAIIFMLIYILAGVYRIYAAMAIGQLSNQNRFLLSFGAYIGLGLVSNIITVAVTTTTMAGVSDTVTTGIIALVQLVVYHVITEFLLTKKLNLE